MTSRSVLTGRVPRRIAHICRIRRERARQGPDPDGQRGTSLIELSIVLGVLVFLLFGIIVYGVTMSYRQSLDQAANEAARAAAVAPRDLAVSRAQAAVERALSPYDTPCGATTKGLTCTFTIDPCDGSPSTDCMTVTLSYDLQGHPRVAAIPGVTSTLPDTLRSRAVVELNPT